MHVCIYIYIYHVCMYIYIYIYTPYIYISHMAVMAGKSTIDGRDQLRAVTRAGAGDIGTWAVPISYLVL